MDADSAVLQMRKSPPWTHSELDGTSHVNASQIPFVLSDGFTALSAAALFEHSLQMTLLFAYLLSSSLSLCCGISNLP